MQVKWLRRALQNLDAEAAHIATDSPKIAGEFVAHIMSSVSMLLQHPQMGRPGRVSGTRELIVTRFSYIIPYRVREGRIEILRIFHTARKWPDKF